MLLKITPKKTHVKVRYREGYRYSEVGVHVARRKAMAQGKAAPQHASNAIDLRLNELLGKYVITLSNTHAKGISEAVHSLRWSK